ncbi:MAG: class II fumarate hydratase [Pseudomonadota bacterium]
MSENFRIEKDSMGELKVPADALYGAQTQRAVENFPISGLVMPRQFIRALGLIKSACASANTELGLMGKEIEAVVKQAAMTVASGDYDDHFPIDIFQTGSGTSTNMNANEVIAHLASGLSEVDVHPNDHVNMSQSSNDIIPTAIHVSACLQIEEELKPALAHLYNALKNKGAECEKYVKTGRTHLMDAMPVTMGQEINAWAKQIEYAIQRIDDSLNRLRQLAQGGTAVGSGINADEKFGELVAKQLAEITSVKFESKPNKFEGLATQDAAVEMSGQLKALAVSLMKISNDLRWMNSGPLAGLGEIALPALQPGSSIMPGKVNPVIPEAVAMVSTQVIGNDTTIMMAGQSGIFQLNVMLPVIAFNLLQSIQLLANSSKVLADKAIKDFTVNEENLQDALAKNPILVTAMNRVIGYEKGAAIAKEAYASGRPIFDVAKEMTDLSDEQINKLLDPAALTKGGIQEA